MGRRQLRLGRSSCPPQVPPRCLHPSGRCLSLGGVTPSVTQGCPLCLERRSGEMGGGEEPAQGGTRAGMGTRGCQPAGGIGLTTPSTCAPGSWASSWGSGKPVRTPRTARHCPGPCQERGATQSWAPPAPSCHCHAPHLGHPLTRAAPHPLPQGCSPKTCWFQHPKGCPPHFAQHHQPWGRLAPTVQPLFWGQLVPVVLRRVLVRQHLQVDGLGSPLDAPVLQGRKVPMGELDGAPQAPAPTRACGVLAPTRA